MDQIFDARALRVVIGDGDGKLHVAAVEGCYNLLSVVHRCVYIKIHIQKSNQVYNNIIHNEVVFLDEVYAIITSCAPTYR